MATTRKKVVKKKAAVKSKELMTMADYEKRFEQEANEQYEREPAGTSNYIDARGGMFSFSGEDIGETMQVVILADVFENAYYDGLYDEDNPQPPGCFAIAEERVDLMPDGDGPNLQNEGPCQECWADEFGSDDRGRGKACKNSRRVAVLGVIQDEEGDPVDIEFGTIPFIKIPPTSLTAYSGYIKRSNKIVRRPSYAYITEIGFDDSVDYKCFTFRLVKKIEDVGLLSQIDDVRLTVMDDLTAPFDVSQYVPVEERVKPTRSTSKKKVAKKKAPARRRSKMS